MWTGRRRSSAVRWSLAASAAIACIAGLLLLSGAPPTEHNFSQYPGFAEYFAANPPSDRLPDADERALLERHRPRFHLPADHAGLIGFYEDYLAQGELRDGEGTVVSNAVDRALLNAHRDDPAVVFEHRPDAAAAQTPVVLARIDHRPVEYRGTVTRFTFATYNAVFRHSGLVAGLAAWQALPAALFGDLDDWHQLDHYTAATLVFTAAGTPVALMLQQHNYVHTYLIGEGYALAEDGRAAVDVAIRSNELYPHAPGRREHRSVRFPDAASMRYLLGAGAGPWLAAHDVTDPAGEASYGLAFLPHDDAFYMFEGFLGARRALPGRDAPPGAAYNTLPRYKPLELQMVLGYWREGHAGDIARFEAALKTGDWAGEFIAAQREVFFENLGCLERKLRGCTLR
jgi:hypothetical protein